MSFAVKLRTYRIISCHTISQSIVQSILPRNNTINFFPPGQSLFSSAIFKSIFEVWRTKALYEMFPLTGKYSVYLVQYFPGNQSIIEWLQSLSGCSIFFPLFTKYDWVQDFEARVSPLVTHAYEDGLKECDITCEDIINFVCMPISFAACYGRKNINSYATLVGPCEKKKKKKQL